MKTNINISFFSNGACQDIGTFERSESCCSRTYRNRVLLYLSLAGVIFILAFGLGYFLPASLTRIIWLISTGTLTVLTCISLILVIQCTRVLPEKEDHSEDSNSKTVRP